MLQIRFDTFPATLTERLDLRAFVPEDAEQLFHLRSHPEITRHLDRDNDKDVAAVTALIERMASDFQESGSVAWAMRLRGQQEIIGSISIWRIDHKNHRGEIGYMMLPEHWGKGLMSEAMQHLLKVAFQDMRLHSLEANTALNNTASHALLERHGFVREAHFRENWYYNGVFSDSIIYCKLTDLR